MHRIRRDRFISCIFIQVFGFVSQKEKKQLQAFVGAPRHEVVVTTLAFEDVQAVNLYEKDSKILGVKPGDASLKIFRRAINDKNVPIEFTISLARGDRFIYRSRQYNHLV